MTEKEVQYSESTKLFSLALGQYRLYSENHPQTQTAARNFFTNLTEALRFEASLTFAVATGRLLVNGTALDNKITGVVPLVRECSARQIQRLIFERGLREEEVRTFLRLMVLPPKAIEQAGGFRKRFDQERLQHIRLATARYELVGEEDKVVGKTEIAHGREEGFGEGEGFSGGEGLGGGEGEGKKGEEFGRGEGHGPSEGLGGEGEEGFGGRMEGGPGEGLGPGEGEGIGAGPEGGRGIAGVRAPSAFEWRPKIGRMDELIEYCAGGARGAVDCDAARLANEVEKKTPELARELVDRAASPQELSLIADHLGGFLQERLGEVFVKQGKDPSQPIYRLGRELKKALKSHEDRLVYRGSTEAAVEVLERHADGARVEWIARTFEESGRDFQTLKKLAGRFLYSRELRDRLLGPLKERLAGSGVPEDDLEEFFAGIVKRGTPGRVRRGALSAQQAEDVRRLRERFDEEVSRRVQKEVGAIQKEFKRTLDEKERVDTIIRNMAEGLVVVDNEGKIQLMNPAAEKLLGISLEEGKGVPITQLSKAEHLLALARGPLTDQAEHVTKEIELKSVQDDTRRILQASSAVIENEQGRTVGMVSVLSDITRQKEIEEMKSAFVAHVSHELRTPLFAIEQSLALLLDKEAVSLNPQEEQFLSIAHRNIIRLARLVDDLLDVAKIEARQMRLRKISFKICDLVHHVAETVRGWAGTNQLTIEEKYPESDLEIEADPDRLTQVVTNLLGNAIKFTPPGGKITVEVDTHHSEPEISEEPCIAVSVQDTGIGIAREDQKRIFEKFEQVSLARPKGISSTGLGLTIAKEIVELHGGKIWLRSGEGEGSRFTFVIPRQAPRPAET